MRGVSSTQQPGYPDPWVSSTPPRAAKEAWGAQAVSEARSKGGLANGRGSRGDIDGAVTQVLQNVFSPSDALRRLLYTPPCSFENFGKILQVSTASSCPRVPKTAFVSRIASLDKALTRQQITDMWDTLAEGRETILQLEKIYEIISTKFGKDKSSSKSGSVVDKVVAKIIERCGGAYYVKFRLIIFLPHHFNNSQKRTLLPRFERYCLIRWWSKRAAKDIVYNG